MEGWLLALKTSLVKWSGDRQWGDEHSISQQDKLGNSVLRASNQIFKNQFELNSMSDTWKTYWYLLKLLPKKNRMRIWCSLNKVHEPLKGKPKIDFQRLKSALLRAAEQILPPDEVSGFQSS